MNTVYWLCAMVVFIIIEAATPALISIWFALGALVSAICSYFGMGTSGAMVVFALVSAISLVIFKKFYNKKLMPEHEPTNADRLIGACGLVTEAIEPISAKGTVEVFGRVWSAKSDEAIELGSRIEVVKIEGVKLIVKKV